MANQSVMLLSVGGQLFTTTASTLTSAFSQGSMLKKLVEIHECRQQVAAGAVGGMQPSLSDPRHLDALFIDRDGSTFSYILNYLRDGPEVVLPADLHTTQQLSREARYYRLTALVQLLEQHAQQLQHGKRQMAKHVKMIWAGLHCTGYLDCPSNSSMAWVKTAYAACERACNELP